VAAFSPAIADLCVHNILGEDCTCEYHQQQQQQQQFMLAAADDDAPASFPYPFHNPLLFADPDGYAYATDEEPSWSLFHMPATPAPLTLHHHDDDEVAIKSESGPRSPSPLNSVTSTPPMFSAGYACHHCGKGFRRNSDLTKHRRYHFKDHECPFNTCNKAFATVKDLNRHLKTHEKGSGFRCPVHGCGKARAGHIYNRRDNFLRHMKKKHANAWGGDQTVSDCYGVPGGC